MGNISAMLVLTLFGLISGQIPKNQNKLTHVDAPDDWFS